jgi:predicted protein tyrosine phosphatase
MKPPAPSSFSQRLFVCGADELDRHQLPPPTHLITVANPGAAPSRPSWFKGEHLQLFFGDVISEADAAQCRTKAPTLEDVRRALGFFRGAWRTLHSVVLVSCSYGASRSPALAYVFLADQLGVGREAEAFAVMLNIRPNAVPNDLVVRLGDRLLERPGALLAPLRELYRSINAGLANNNHDT